MKLNEKQLTIIFLVIFALLLLGSYFFIQHASPIPTPSENKHAVQVTPIAGKDKALAEKVLSEKLAPLSKEDSGMAQQVIFSKAPKPLSVSEQAAQKRILGN